jgi:hypothetical protein
VVVTKSIKYPYWVGLALLNSKTSPGAGNFRKSIYNCLNFATIILFQSRFYLSILMNNKADINLPRKQTKFFKQLAGVSSFIAG